MSMKRSKTLTLVITKYKNNLPYPSQSFPPPALDPANWPSKWHLRLFKSKTQRITRTSLHYASSLRTHYYRLENSIQRILQLIMLMLMLMSICAIITCQPHPPTSRAYPKTALFAYFMRLRHECSNVEISKAHQLCYEPCYVTAPPPRFSPKNSMV